MNPQTRRRSENSALHPRVMDDTPTSTGVPSVGLNPTVPASQAHAEILTRYFVSRYVTLFYGVE